MCEEHQRQPDGSHTAGGVVVCWLARRAWPAAGSRSWARCGLGRGCPSRSRRCCTRAGRTSRCGLAHAGCADGRLWRLGRPWLAPGRTGPRRGEGKGGRWHPPLPLPQPNTPFTCRPVVLCVCRRSQRPPLRSLSLHHPFARSRTCVCSSRRHTAPCCCWTVRHVAWVDGSVVCVVGGGVIGGAGEREERAGRAHATPCGCWTLHSAYDQGGGHTSGVRLCKRHARGRQPMMFICGHAPPPHQDPLPSPAPPPTHTHSLFFPCRLMDGLLYGQFVCSPSTSPAPRP